MSWPLRDFFYTLVGHRQGIVMKRAAILFFAILTLAACDFQKDADAKFGDQHFKTAISLIELHKIRFGGYPETLKDLKFVGDWDAIALSGIEYRRLDTGYELNLVRGWTGKPDVSYPPEFWKGLGLVKSNVKG
jgi:hypothetical protein